MLQSYGLLDALRYRSLIRVYGYWMLPKYYAYWILHAYWVSLGHGDMGLARLLHIRVLGMGHSSY